ncbi:MAG: SCO family protein [Verrucomicrobia bacterium]|nr:SCO family protein [Verrucomicrobiota bacterium]
MNAAPRRIGSGFWVGLGLAVLTLAVLLVWTRLKDLRPPLPVFGQVADFALTNQTGAPVSLDRLRGHVWVADVIFTRCPLQCGEMSKRMSELQAALPAKSPVKLVSLTMDPEYDTVPVLKRYSEKYEAHPDRWWFLTGSKEQVGNVLTNNLKLSAMETAPERRTNQFDLFTHSTLFVVVDQQARLRTAVESLQPGWKDRILDDINRLLREAAP